MKLVVRVADYGMTDSITDGALKGIRDGIVTDVGLMTNNHSAKRAAQEILKYDKVSVGQDLNLVSGYPLSDPKEIPALVNQEGRFYSSSERKKQELPFVPYEQIYHEMEQQVLKFIELMGRKPSYITGHSYSTKELDQAMRDICKKYEITLDCFNLGDLYVGNRWYFQTKGPDGRPPVFDLNAQGDTDVKGFILQDRCEVLNKEYAMIATHAGYCDGELMQMSTFNVIRGVELEALCSKEVKEWVENNKIKLINMDEYKEETGVR